MTGKDLQKAVVDLARTLGWKVAHFPAMQGRDGIWRTAVAADGKGFPDLLLVRDRCIVVEIKGDGDRLRDEQADWLTAFRMAGIAAHVWTPASWETGEIERILTARKQDVRLGAPALPLTGPEREDVIGRLAEGFPPELLGGIPT